MLNLAVLLEHSAREWPDREAVAAGARRLTYREVDAAASRIADALVARGIRPGDRVAMCVPNVPEFLSVYYGILKAGAAVVPLSTLLRDREIAFQLIDSGATALFCYEGDDALPVGAAGVRAFESAPRCTLLVVVTDDPQADTAGVPGETLARFTAGREDRFPGIPTAEDETAVVLYTSGTTGRPKGAELTHSNLVQNALLYYRTFGPHPHDVHLVSLPLFHTFAQTVQMNSGLAHGATLILQRRFDPAGALALMRQERVTFFAGVPTAYWALLTVFDADRADIAGIAAHLRCAVAGGSALPLEVLQEFEKRFGVPILEGYGLSETSPLVTFNRFDRPRRPGSIGLPVWGVEVRVVRDDGSVADVDEPGEICVRGHNVMRRYLHRPDATAQAIDRAGWLRTGDIGTRDADGYFYVIDRKKDMIIRGGFNVYPRELEEVLVTHPDVSLAAVVGVPHDSHGEEIKAFVIRRPGAALTERELIDWSRAVLAAHKYPRIVEFRDALPMTVTGKILKRELVRDRQ
ncbi:long-chain-fatty-acid--CoA ligase [Nocardia sp. IFM 10818]